MKESLVVVTLLVGLVLAGCAAVRDGAGDASLKGPVLQDAEGRKYRVRTIPKAQAKKIDDAHVRTNWGIKLDLVGEDEASWHYKLYDVARYEPAPVATPSAAERKRVAASYVADVGSGDRLRWEPFGEGLPSEGQWRDGFDLADVDGDGALDLVHGPPRGGRPVPRVFRGDAKGHWRAWREASYPPLAIDYGDAAAGDLDGDGRADLVLSAHLRGFAAFRNEGGGRFSDMGRGLELVTPSSGAPPPFSSRGFTLVDWNGDGRLDILALGEGPRLGMGRGDRRDVAGASMGVALFENRGADGWRRAPTDFDTANDVFGQSIALGDFDGDGRRDFATASNTLGRTDLLSLGTPTGEWRRVALQGARPQAYVRAVAAADFDADGRDDLALAYTSYELDTWRSGIDVLLSRGGGAFERRTLTVTEGTTGVFALATGDLDGDRRRDLVALTGDGDVVVFLGDGTGRFRRETRPPSAWPDKCRGVHVALRDLDRDGRDEIVAAFAEESSDVTGEMRCPRGGGLTAWSPVPR